MERWGTQHVENLEHSNQDLIDLLIFSKEASRENFRVVDEWSWPVSTSLCPPQSRHRGTVAKVAGSVCG
jgi:hypothetical protein